MGEPVVRPLGDRDRPWVRAAIAASWGLPVVTPTGCYDDPAALDGFVAELDGELVGALTYRIDGEDWEIVTLEATTRRRGAGRALVTALAGVATDAGARRLWLITTDDDPGALAFYRALGFVEVARHPRFVDVVRAAKPTLPSDAFTDAIELAWRPWGRPATERVRNGGGLDGGR